MGKPSYLLQWGELLRLQLQPCAPEFPLVAPRPGRAGGYSDGGGGQQRHQNRSRLWAGAALGGSLCRASSKDGQRVRRRPRPRSLLARDRHHVPEPPLEVGAVRTCRPRQGDGKRAGPGAGELGGAEPARGRGAETMAARAPSWAERGAPAAPSPHLCGASRAEGRGHQARWAARGALESSPRTRPRGGAVRTRERRPGPGAGLAETPVAPRRRRRRDGGAAAAPPFFISVQQKGTRFPFSETSSCLIFLSSLLASRSDLNWGPTEMARVCPRVR